MPLMDEFKDERETIKNAPFKERAAYFWEYYKWWVIGGAIAIIAIVMTVRSFILAKQDVLYVGMINTVELPESNAQTTIIEPFLEEHGYNIKKNNVRFDTDLKMNISSSNHVKENTLPDNLVDNVTITNSASARQNLSIYIAAATVDLLVCSENWFDEYAYGGFFTDLRTVFTEAELEKYNDYIFYADGAVIDRYTQASKEMNYDYSEMFPDSYDIEAMENPVPLGLIIGEKNLIAPNFAFATESKEDKIVIGFISNGNNKLLAHDLVVRLMHE